MSPVIRKIKYLSQKNLCQYLGEIMALEPLPAELLHDADALIPVPLTPQRMRQRGYNQSAELCVGISRLTHLPVIVDPSHAVGVRDKISPMALAAIASGADGIVVEVHNCPEKALSDGPQALLPEMFDKLMHDIEAMAPVVGKSVVHIRGDILAKVDKKTVNEKKNGKIICAYNGKPGAYAEQAVTRYFDGEADSKSVESFREIFKAVLSGEADCGMVPIENSLAGSVYQNYDNLSDFEDVSIVGALHLRIQHALLAPKGTTLDSIKRVFSHPQGLAQCSKFLATRNWEKIDASSTSTAAKIVADKGSVENAAIASAVTTEYYNLEILQEDIQDDCYRLVYIRHHYILFQKPKNHQLAIF